jgi:hypothetical protein
VPRLGGNDTERLSPSWEKLKRTAEEAKGWLDGIYLLECERNMSLAQIEGQVREVSAASGHEPAVIVIDDCQRLGAAEASLASRLPIVVEQLQEAIRNLQVPLIGRFQKFCV